LRRGEVSPTSPLGGKAVAREVSGGGGGLTGEPPVQAHQEEVFFRGGVGFPRKGPFGEREGGKGGGRRRGKRASTGNRKWVR